MQRSRVRFPALQVFWLVDLERGPLSLESTIEELLGRNSSGSGIEIQGFGHRETFALTTRHPLLTTVGTNLADKLRSLGRYKATESVFDILSGRAYSKKWI
jgi:hypothetical protein